MPPDSHLTEQRQVAPVILSIVWMVSIGYVAIHLKNGWVPHDEGTLGLSAERRPEFSKALASELQGALGYRYPHFEEAGRFEVRWKE